MSPVYGITAGEKCLQKSRPAQAGHHRRPLSEHEKKKLVWYRDERKWIEDIRNRRVPPQR